MSRQDQHPAIKRAKKLAALATSANRHEAEAALAKLQELMLRYNLDPSLVAAVEDEETGFVHHTLDLGKRASKEALIAAEILTGFFNVKCLLMTQEIGTAKKKARHKAIRIVGKHADVVIAEHVHAFLVRFYRAEWLRHVKQLDASHRQAVQFVRYGPHEMSDIRAMEDAYKKALPQARIDFMVGISYGVAGALERQRETLQKEHAPEGTPAHALIVTNKAALQAEVAEKYGQVPTSTTKETDVTDAMIHGYQAGLKVNLNPAVTAGKEKPQ